MKLAVSGMHSHVSYPHGVMLLCQPCLEINANFEAVACLQPLPCCIRPGNVNKSSLSECYLTCLEDCMCVCLYACMCG